MKRTVADIRAAVDNNTVDDQQAAKRRGTVERLRDGFPPFDIEELEKEGEAWRSNFNTLKMEGLILSRVSGYVDLLTGSQRATRIRPKDGTLPAWYRKAVGETVEVLFQNLLDAWPGYYTEMIASASEMVTHGIGLMHFADPKDWRFKAVEYGAVMVGKRSGVDPDKIPIIGITDRLKLADIFDHWRTKAEGWNHAKLGEILADCLPDQAGKGLFTDVGLYEGNAGDNVTEIETAMRSACSLHDSSSADTASPLDVVFCYMQDPERGKIDVGIMQRQAGANDDWLYMKEGLWPNARACYIPLLCDPRRRQFRSVRGLGTKALRAVLAEERLVNHLVDAARLTTLTWMEGSGNPTQGAKDRKLRIAPITQLPRGRRIADVKSQSRIAEALRMLQELSQRLSDSVGAYQPSVKEGSAEQTIPQAKLATMREAKIENSEIAYYYTRTDMLYQEVLDRLWTSPDREAAEFREACTKMGIPDEMMKRGAMLVKSRRAIGGASMALRRSDTAELIGLSPHFTDRGQKESIKAATATLVGWENVEDYIDPESEEQGVKSPPDAMMEESIVMLGGPASFGQGQNHIGHADSHLRRFDAEMKTIGAAGTGDPNMLLQVGSRLSQTLEVMLGNVAQHLDVLAGMPLYKQHYTRLLEIFKVAGKNLGALRNNMQQLMAAQQAQAQAAQEAQIREQENAARETQQAADADGKAAREEARKDFQASEENRRKEEKHRIGLQQKTEAHAVRTAIKLDEASQRKEGGQ